MRSALAFLLPLFAMPAVFRLLHGVDQWLTPFGQSARAQALLAQSGIALPLLAAAATGTIFLFAVAGSLSVKRAGCGVGAGAAFVLAMFLYDLISHHAAAFALRSARIDFAIIEPAWIVGTSANLALGAFALRVILLGNAAFGGREPRRIAGRRGIHGDARWMSMREAQMLFSSRSGMVIGERYRVDRDSIAAHPFFTDRRATWGKGGKAELLCFDGSFGSSHGLVFSGSGGFKTTSVTVPSALTWAGSLILLDPSGEVAPLVTGHRDRDRRRVRVLDPKSPHVGFNVLDWIGRYGGSKEEDIASVASWIMSDSGRLLGARDDFFRASAQQLLTAMIADVCLSGQTPPGSQTLRQVRTNLSEPEPKLRERLQEIHATTASDFVRENVAAFVNMTPETFSGVYANTVKETHWLSYPNYAALVSGSSFSTDDVADGKIDVFIAIDLKALETHSGLARVIIGALLNAIYNRNGAVESRVLFLIDEAARLGFMRILETARDAGRKYGITLLMLFQSIGQLREAYGGRDASSKWFESASWVSFAAINDPETAEYISRRCGMTTVETEQVSRGSQARGASVTRSKQLAARPLILPHEVLRMRSDEQIIFTAGNPPLRCGRAIWFRRNDMVAWIGSNAHARRWQ